MLGIQVFSPSTLFSPRIKDEADDNDTQPCTTIRAFSTVSKNPRKHYDSQFFKGQGLL